MKTAHIEPGCEYIVHLSERQSLVYRGCDVTARAVRVGFHYDVESTYGSMIRGAPNTHVQQSEHATGVEVEWNDQEVPSLHRHMRTQRAGAGHAIVNARQVKRPA